MTIKEKLDIFECFLLLYNHDFMFLRFLKMNTADILINLELLDNNKEIFDYLKELYKNFI